MVVPGTVQKIAISAATRLKKLAEFDFGVPFFAGSITCDVPPIFLFFFWFFFGCLRKTASTRTRQGIALILSIERGLSFYYLLFHSLSHSLVSSHCCLKYFTVQKSKWKKKIVSSWVLMKTKIKNGGNCERKLIKKNITSSPSSSV